MNKKIVVILGLVVLLVVGILYRLDQLEIDYDQKIEVSFESSGKMLSGSLYVPSSPPPYDVVFFIHGDGPSDRTLGGGYNFLINHLLEEGIACFSYDKAGVGKSEGNWLDQTMKDRSQELEDGLKALQDTVAIKKKGLLGFSQGGWVISEFSKAGGQADFIVLVGGAIDWMDQHMYYERKVAKKRDYSQEETNAYLNYVKTYDTYILKDDYKAYVDYVSKFDYDTPMSQDRFRFAHMNSDANAIAGIKTIKSPFLGLFGQNDQNVDVQESYKVYDETFKAMGKENYKLHIFSGATHELLKSRYQDRKNLLFIHSFLIGDHIFVDDFFTTLSQWIKDLP